jgi:exportin-T
VDTRCEPWLPSGLHNDNSRFRLRLFYFCHRFIKELRNKIPADIVPTVIASTRDLLPIVVEIPEAEEPETDLLSEAIKDATFSSQLYLYETTGALCSLIFKTPAEQAAMLLSLVKPLMNDLSLNFQAFRSNGSLDLIAKSFPDYPNPVPQNYILPPLEVFAEIVQAILVCLEVMKRYASLGST